MNANSKSTLWPYTQQFKILKRDPLAASAPNVGAPCLVRHIGLWPRASAIPDNPSKYYTDSKSADEAMGEAFEAFNKGQEDFYDEINSFSQGLQARGRVKRHGQTGEIDTISSSPLVCDKEVRNRAIVFCNPQSVAFTLWLQDYSENSKTTLNQRVYQPDASAIRVRVHVQTMIDHVTLSFYVDVGKPYGGTQLAANSATAPGRRRKRIMQYFEALTALSVNRIQEDRVTGPLLPEQDFPPEQDALLREAADYLYEGIWSELAEAFEFKHLIDKDDTQLIGKRFADFRSVVMSAPGLETEANIERRNLREQLRADHAKTPKINPNPDYLEDANIGFGPHDVFDKKAGEPNTVVKSLWPFIRRANPGADYTNFVACGLIGFRALYVTALGGGSSRGVHDEWPVGKGRLAQQNRHKRNGAHRRSRRRKFWRNCL